MVAKVILNPYSGRWTAGKRQSEIEIALRAAVVPFELSRTEGRGHAIELARQAVLDGYPLILSAGGDGTVSEVVNGILSAEGGSEVVFGIMPVGTANDLADNLAWPKDLAEAAIRIAAGKVRKMDVCRMNDRYFVNNAGLGLEPFISTIQMKMTRLRGNIRYLTAAVRGILANPQWVMDMQWEGGAYSGPCTLVSIGNCARTGGIFYTVPHADAFDGRLSFIRGYVPTRLKLLKAFPMIMKPAEGNVTEHPDVHEVHTTWLKVHTHTPTPAHADGEVITEAETNFDFQVHPGLLNILSV